ncbi:hypothetical protein BYT27DRAFT_7245835 [Phlegmacium glaucopus]|nr:hypothetical protein BYT27DRAFT_7245835 [Phlegmacium glaucopus]
MLVPSSLRVPLFRVFAWAWAWEQDSRAAVVGVHFSVEGFWPSVLWNFGARERNAVFWLFSSQIAILNGAGVVGRLAANHPGDIYGVWNIQVPVTLMTGATIWAVLGVTFPLNCSFWLINPRIWLSMTLAGVATLSTSPQEAGCDPNFTDY